MREIEQKLKDMGIKTKNPYRNAVESVLLLELRQKGYCLKSDLITGCGGYTSKEVYKLIKEGIDETLPELTRKYKLKLQKVKPNETEDICIYIHRRKRGVTHGRMG